MPLHPPPFTPMRNCWVESNPSTPINLLISSTAVLVRVTGAVIVVSIFYNLYKGINYLKQHHGLVFRMQENLAEWVTPTGWLTQPDFQRWWLTSNLVKVEPSEMWRAPLYFGTGMSHSFWSDPPLPYFCYLNWNYVLTGSYCSTNSNCRHIYVFYCYCLVAGRI